MTDAELAAIEARCRAATAGPWERSFPVPNPDGPKGAGAWFASVDREGECDLVARAHHHTAEGALVDATFIAHSRTDVEALCADNRELRVRAEKAEAEVRRLSDALDAAARIVKRKADRAAGREET